MRGAASPITPASCSSGSAAAQERVAAPRPGLVIPIAEGRIRRAGCRALGRSPAVIRCIYACTGINAWMARTRRQSYEQNQPKPVRWVGSSKEDLSGFPEDVRRRVGGALWDAQIGGKAPYTKPLKGFGDAAVLEIVDDFDGDTFRAVYTVRFAEVIYVLHAFQKKSRRGIATPKAELDLIEQRLKRAREDYQQWSRNEILRSR